MAESPFPLPSLGLLVPPLRMMSAVMWQVVRQGNTKHYGKLEEFVSMVTEVVPELLSNRQRWLLILALRGRVRDSQLISGIFLLLKSLGVKSVKKINVMYSVHSESIQTP
uniref:TERF1-interacting nuclear factor 2 N-terminal domain-containing protein n=1 Tax=Hucho hucho TaxID=62062 RepID=A0A4W5K6K2_9TELE